MLDGILPENLKRTITEEEGVIVNRKPTHPATGSVFLEGSPVVGAHVVFHHWDDFESELERHVSARA